MRKASIRLSERIDLSGSYRVELEVFEVEQDEKFPNGVKASFVLIDVQRGVPRLIVDNHAPFGFHVHSELPDKKHVRRTLEIDDYTVALDEFWRLVGGVIEDEN